MFTHRIDDNLQLRLPEERDAEEVFTLIDSSRAHLGQWMSWAEAFTHKDSLPWIQGARQQYASQASLIAFAMFKGKLAGAIGLARMDVAHRRGELTYWIGSNFEGKGIVTNASRAIFAHAFTSLNFYRIDA